MRITKFLATITGLLGLAMSTTTVTAKPQISMTPELGHSVLLKNKAQKAYIRVILEGSEIENTEDRTPVNIAIVIDKSGSMSGAKLERAKDAAIMAINRLTKDDIVSVISYDTKVRVIIPSTYVTNKRALEDKVDRLRAGGSTALYDGVSAGIGEVKEYLSRNKVNRVILLSDGLANIGPSSPEELGELGRSVAKDGISITTIGLGLGYNEDLMSKLAFNSDGNHAFVENENDLVKVFNSEFGDVLSVIAQDIELEFEFEDDIRPLRSLGRSVNISGSKAVFQMNQMYSSQKKEFILEVDVPKNIDASKIKVARIKLKYTDMKTKKQATNENTLETTITASEADWQNSANKTVMSSVSKQIAIKENERAVKLRDKGKIKEARKVLNDNAVYLKEQSKRYDAPELEVLSESNSKDAQNLDARNWQKSRKLMRARQYKGKTQQSY